VNLARAEKRCFQIHADDNVATVLQDVDCERLLVLGQIQHEVEAVEAIAMGHKIALKPIVPGTDVIKFGVPIALATTLIAPGQWVHLHNSRSQLDERSNQLDVHTGAATDTAYE
jgi:hypothetical protein